MAAQQPRQPDPQAPRSDRAYQAAQAALVVAVAGMVHRAMRLLDVHDLKGTTPKVAAALYAVTTRYGRTSAALALSHYRQERSAAGIAGRVPTLRPAPLPTLEQITANVEWAASRLYGPADTQMLADFEAEIAAATERLVLDVGRESIIAAIGQDQPTRQDQTPRRWAREVEPGCCFWCAMLATRGAVYRTAEGAGLDNSFHDHCRCQIVPVFGKYEPTAQVRQWASDYQTATDGLSGKDAVKAWRQHFEGRTPATPALVGAH